MRAALRTPPRRADAHPLGTQLPRCQKHRRHFGRKPHKTTPRSAPRTRHRSVGTSLGAGARPPPAPHPTAPGGAPCPPGTAAATTPRRWPRPLGRGGRPVTHVGTVPRYGTAGLAHSARSSPPFPGIFSPEINNSSGIRHRLPERGGRGAARHPKQTEPPSQRLCPADSSSRTFKYTPGPRGG